MPTQQSHTIDPTTTTLRRLIQVSFCSLVVLCMACSQDSTKKDAQEQGVETGTDETGANETGDADRILRHAVFFSFKETSSEEDVQGVVDAFCALPDKIDSIVDFQWGTNNSPEGKNDGLTHCFLLSFKDDAGREEYLPHDAHKAFGDVLRPHMDKVFVVDFWGTPSKEKIENPLQHLVFLKFKDDADEKAVTEVVDAFAALPSKIDTIKAFEWGINNSPEGKNDDLTHAFVVTFDSEEGRAAYLPHAEHAAFVEVLLPVLDKARVIDFSAGK